MIRLHSGRAAAAAAALFGAEAFTVGRHVFLSRWAARELASGSDAGAELLAHELAHVAQYRRHGLAGFLARYLFHYLAGRARGLRHREAYAAIPFERAARD